jgi:hypothetical protein
MRFRKGEIPPLPEMVIHYQKGEKEITRPTERKTANRLISKPAWPK